MFFMNLYEIIIEKVYFKLIQKIILYLNNIYGHESCFLLLIDMNSLFKIIIILKYDGNSFITSEIYRLIEWTLS